MKFFKNKSNLAGLVIFLSATLMAFGNLIPLKQIQGGTSNGQVIKMKAGLSVWDSLDASEIKNLPSSGTNMATANQTVTGNRTHNGNGMSWVINTLLGFDIATNNNTGFGLTQDEFYLYTSNATNKTRLTTSATTNRDIQFPNANGIIALINQFSGGTTGQALVKTANTDYAWSWQTISSGVTLGTDTVMDRTIVSGDISGSTVTIPVVFTPLTTIPRMLFLNGVKVPHKAYTVTGTNYVVNNTLVPYVGGIGVGDYVEMSFSY